MPAYVVYRPSVMRSGRLPVRAAAVAALLMAAAVAFVVITHAGGSEPQSTAKHAAPAGSLASVKRASPPVAKGGSHAVAEKAVGKAPAKPVHKAAKPKAHAAVIPAPKTTPVAILNGGTAQGAAAALADKLRSLGYPVPVVGNAGRRDLPMAIEYSAGLGPAARALARHVGAVQYVTPLEGPNRNLSGARLLVIVGN
jgi:LytR cell envelope-related transcriptional attenuator